MTANFEVIQSIKTGLNSKESHIVIRGRTSFLRILGANPQWELMTATASEDYGHITVCTDQFRLVESALRFAAELKITPTVERDWAGREYVKICSINQHKERSDEEFKVELSAAINKFFEIYGSRTALDSRAKVEMIDLYDIIATDGVGSDVYLSDGVWLRKDGSLSTHDN